MILIGENIHIISKRVKTALENRDENFIKDLISVQSDMDVLDFNIGPAKGKLAGIFEWLSQFVINRAISFDSSNIDAIEQGLKVAGNENCFINSTNADDEKLDKLTDLALEYNCNLIALCMSKETGIPKTADARLELVFKIYEKCMEKGISSEKLFFDPLILPLKIDQSQVFESLNTIQMIKESFEPKVQTLVGLSNISNGIAAQQRQLFNRVFGILAYGAGLDAAILDAKDCELIRIFKMLENDNPQNEIDNLYKNLANVVKCFGEFDGVSYDKKDIYQCNIMRAVEILTGKSIYSDSFAQLG